MALPANGWKPQSFVPESLYRDSKICMRLVLWQPTHCLNRLCASSNRTRRTVSSLSGQSGMTLSFWIIFEYKSIFRLYVRSLCSLLWCIVGGPKVSSKVCRGRGGWMIGVVHAQSLTGIRPECIWTSAVVDAVWTDARFRIPELFDCLASVVTQITGISPTSSLQQLLRGCSWY